jgi:hypothetical protein
MEDHESRYKFVLSHVRMIADLIRGFAAEDGAVEKVGGSFTTKNLRQRENDWRLGSGQDEWVYVFILLELWEVESMLAENALTWTEAWKQEGRQETLRQLQEILALQLEKRFGPLSEGARSRLEAIDSVETLSELIARGATARSIDELGLA